MILKNLKLLLHQGYSINDSIMLLDLKEKDFIYKEFLKGEMFSKILEDLKFDKDILLIIKISENSGQVALGIEKAHKILEQKIKNKNNVLEQLKYPIILSIVLILALLFISNFLLPMFLRVYKNFGIEIDGVFLLFITLLRYLPIVFLIIFIFGFIFILYLNILEQSDRLKLILKNKLIRKQYYKAYNNLFLFNLYSLLNLDINLSETFYVLANQEYNYMLRKESQKIYKKLKEGEELHIILKKRKIYNEKIIIAIEQGIATNMLKENINSILLFEENIKREKTAKIIMLIQPIIYLFFGLIIVLLYMSIFIPMFKMMDAL